MHLFAPTVMLSSTITELADLRSELGRRLESTGTATAWRFEAHAVSAGASADEQYLGIARTCDIYVLIIADQQSDATEQEYETAYEDNPEKILTFFVGEGSAEVAAFRERIERRHTRVKRDTASELVGDVEAAVVEAVNTGKLLRPLLLRDLDARIEKARTLMADVPLIMDPRVNDGNTERRMSDLISDHPHVALCGIGGSGKTVCAAITARKVAEDQRTLPVSCSVSHGTKDVSDLIRDRLSSLRFQAGPDLISRWGNEGRIFLIIDGIEAAPASNRRLLMSSIEAWSEQHPRCYLVVCGRRFSPGELTLFTHCSAAPLTPEEISGLAAALGVGAMSLHLPEQVRDLARWPLWAIALVVYGPQANTGLELLQTLVTTRLATAGMSSPVEAAQLRAAAGRLALEAWPDIEVEVAHALESLASWSANPETMVLFTPRPAEDLLAGLAEAGLVEMGEVVSFPHRLFATILAAEDALADQDRALSVDEELGPFVAALADDDLEVELFRHILSRQTVFERASYLRLSPPRTRSVDRPGDIERLASAYRLWSPTAEHLDVIDGGTWIAWREAGSFTSTRASSSDEYAAWRAQSHSLAEFWPVSPFERRTPEFIAAASTLGQFRRAVLSLDPGGDSAQPMPATDLQRLLSNPAKLESRILAQVRRRGLVRRELLSRLGLLESPGDLLPGGEPVATVWTGQNSDVWLELSWAEGPPRVTRHKITADSMPGSASLLANFLTDQIPVAVYDELKGAVESALGCRLDSQSWGRPELVAAWAW